MFHDATYNDEVKIAWTNVTNNRSGMFQYFARRENKAAQYLSIRVGNCTPDTHSDSRHPHLYNTHVFKRSNMLFAPIPTRLAARSLSSGSHFYCSNVPIVKTTTFTVFFHSCVLLFATRKVSKYVVSVPQSDYFGPYVRRTVGGHIIVQVQS